jgi:chromate transporter
MLLVELFLMFAKVALINFGGGFAMIPLISAELDARQWLSAQEFMDIIAISQMTPGAIAVNTATYVGYQINGILGAAVSTIAIPFPSLVLVITLYPILEKYKSHPVLKLIFYGLRPVVAGLIIAAVYFVANTAWIHQDWIEQSFATILEAFPSSINFISIGLTVATFVVALKTKVSPIVLLLAGAVLGMILF